MKKILLLFVSVLTLASCSNGTPSSRGPQENVYTITWKNWNGDVLEVDNDIKENTKPVYNGSTPTRPDDNEYTYTWSGWTPSVVPAVSNQTYTATYSFEKIKTEYVINFDLNGGTSSSYRGSRTVESFTSEVFFFDCVKEGWNFRGWSYNGTKIFDEKGNQLANPTMARIMTFVATYAQTAKMTIVSNLEGAGNITGEGEYPYNTYVDVSAYAKQGYIFIGWYYQNTLLSNTNDYKYMMWSEDVELEARFKYDNYLLNIHSNSEENGLVLLKSTINNTYRVQYEERCDYKTSVTIAAYSRTDIRFLGWYDTNNQLVETNAVYSFVMPNYDYILEAKWNYFTIDYILDGGINDSSNPTSYTIESSFDFADATKDGYTFVGWFDENGKKVESISLGSNYSLVLTARWSSVKNKLSVTSEDISKGTVAIISGSGYSNESITVEALPIGNCFFIGWYIGETKISIDNPYTFVMPTTDYSLVARFYSEEWAVTHGVIPYFNGNGIPYGLYPQTNVSNSELISNLNKINTPEPNGWYLYNDDYYAKVSASPYDSSYKFDNGTTIVSGTTYWFKCEPITWNVLNCDGNEFFAVSSVLLDTHSYHNSTNVRFIDEQFIYANNYEYSDIRAWLNEDFYKTAFALNDSRIQKTTVDNSASTTRSDENPYACNNTQDKVFLPSYKDYINSSYSFSTSTDSSDTRYCKTTDWARARGAYCTANRGQYWTRSPIVSNYNFRASYVNNSGVLDFGDVVLSTVCARPAITIKL